MSEWANFIIVAVKYDKNNEYLLWAKCYEDSSQILTNSEIVSRSSIVQAIKKGMTYITATRCPLTGLWSKGSRVRIHNDDYLRTAPSSIKRDNIGSLPKL